MLNQLSTSRINYDPSKSGMKHTSRVKKHFDEK